uniref:Uncharacterized protein n=1 Tax=Phlebotomus papatasi TaxID=29031 RepID=A0A1B0D8G6_PHLPP
MGKTFLARVEAPHSECTLIRKSGSELTGFPDSPCIVFFYDVREHYPFNIFMEEIDLIDRVFEN